MSVTQQDDPSALQRFCEDSSGLAGGHADRVYFPRTTEEAAEALHAAHAAQTPITIAGNGTGITGARVPFGGWILATERMDRIFEMGVDLKAQQGYAIVQPGLTLAELKSHAAAQGWTYRPDPTETSCFLGATLATNASGARSFLWGPTRQHVLGLEVLLADGEKVNLERGEVFAQADGTLALPSSTGTRPLRVACRPGPKTKNAAGYFIEPGFDAVDLFIGQEGTLGMITRVTVRLFHAPRSQFAGIVFFESDEAAFAWVRDIRLRSRAAREPGDNQLQATALEYMDDRSLKILNVGESGGTPVTGTIPGKARAAIYFEQAVSANQDEDQLLEDWLQSLESHHVPSDQCWLAQDARTRENLHEWRHQIPVRINEALRRKGLPKIGTDLAVPDEAFSTLWAFYQKTLKEWGKDYAIFGHLGDNHLHINLIPEKEEDVERGRALHRGMAQEAVRLKGTVSAEHGIGKTKHALLQIQLGDAGVQSLRQVKNALDPKGILSPGNIFPL